MYHEIIEGQESLPYHIFLMDGKMNHEHTHTHANLEICFILSGNVEFEVHHKSFPLFEHDFMIVSPLALHQIQNSSDNCRILFLHIDLFSFQKYIPRLSKISFYFSNIMNNRNTPLYQNLYQSMRVILKIIFEGNELWRLTVLQEIINILNVLFTYYHSLPTPQNLPSISQDERIQQRILFILEYLDKHWQEPLTLVSLADTMKMSPSYFSRFFKSNMNIGFLAYLTQLRLNRSLNYLLDTNMPIIDIALECGFNDYKTYGRLFKKQFGENPQEYRKKHSFSKTDATQQPTQIMEQLTLSPIESNSIKKIFISLKLNLNAKVKKRTRFYWNQTINIGSASQLLSHRIQEHILYTKKRIYLKYIRFSNLFSENMQVYWEENDGKFHFNWEYLDEIFDFFNQNQLRPFIVLGSMPNALSTSKYKKTPLSQNICPSGQTCMPKSAENFQLLIREFIHHYIQRYGDADMMEHCRIQLWALPESPESTWNGTEEQFFELVKQTYFTLRQTVSNISIGSPSTMGWDNFSMLKRFLIFCEKEDIHFDFFCINSYGFTSPLNTDYSDIYRPYEEKFSYQKGNQILNESVDNMANILSKRNLTTPIIVTEWALNPYMKDLSRDTAFMATWITEHLLHLSPNIQEICYCMLTDHFSQSSSLYGYPFIGGQGLLTYNGIPKSSFSTFEMLEVLGNEILASGDEYLLTKTGNSWRLLMYNYSYYNDNYLNGKQELLFEEDRYNIYANSLAKVFEIQLDLSPGKYRLETTQISQDYCSPYDEWIKMGKPERISTFYHKYLMNKCYPGLQVETINTTSRLQLQRTVPVHGIIMVKIDPI